MTETALQEAAKAQMPELRQWFRYIDHDIGIGQRAAAAACLVQLISAAEKLKITLTEMNDDQYKAQC